MTTRLLSLTAWMFACGPCGCGGPSVPGQPTWADVRPILAGECGGCHGAGAAASGAGYRFDFYDMTPDVCGDAAAALGAEKPLAQAHAERIWEDISTPVEQPDVRPKMPPPPAPYLADWQWRTIRAWLDAGAVRGAAPAGNRPPAAQLVTHTATDRSVVLTAIVDDQDGDPVVGILKIADVELKMDRSGSFSARLDTSAWSAGEVSATAVLCDGWTNVTVPLGTIAIVR
jgi:hypothetical protein